MKNHRQQSTPRRSANDERALRVYEAYREQIEHEDGLIGLRVGWFIAAEAFLFAAYGVVITVQARPVLPQAMQVDNRLFETVPIVGVVMAVLVGLSIGAAMHRLRLLHTAYTECFGSGPDDYPTLWSNGFIIFCGHIASASVTPIVIVSWFFLWLGRPALLPSLLAVVPLTVLCFGVHFWSWHQYIPPSEAREGAFPTAPYPIVPPVPDSARLMQDPTSLNHTDVSYGRRKTDLHS